MGKTIDPNHIPEKLRELFRSFMKAALYPFIQEAEESIGEEAGFIAPSRI